MYESTNPTKNIIKTLIEENGKKPKKYKAVLIGYGEIDIIEVPLEKISSKPSEVIKLS